MKKLTSIAAVLALLVAGAIYTSTADAHPTDPPQYWAPSSVDTPTECVEWADGYNGGANFWIGPDGAISFESSQFWRWNSYARCILRKHLRNPGDITIFEDGSIIFRETNETMCLPRGACNNNHVAGGAFNS